MRSKPPNCKRLQGAADARRRARRRTFILQVPDNKADAVPCERLRRFAFVKQGNDYETSRQPHFSHPAASCGMLYHARLLRR